MSRHTAIEELIAVYRDLSPGEKRTVDEHVAECPPCAARLASFAGLEAKLEGLSPRRLPAVLARPFDPTRSVQPAFRGSTAPAGTPEGATGGLSFARTFASAAVVLAVIAGVWLGVASMNTSRSEATATPTMTLTPTATLVSHNAGRWAGAPGVDRVAQVRPAPAPAPRPRLDAPSLAGGAPLFLVPLSPHATIVR